MKFLGSVDLSNADPLTGFPSTGAGSGTILVNTPISLPTGFEFNQELIVNTPTLIFSRTLANAISTPPSGWAVRNSAKLSSADANVSTANRLRLTHVGNATSDFSTSVSTFPSFTRKIYSADADIVTRVHKVDGHAGAGTTVVLTVTRDEADGVVNTGYVRALVGYPATGPLALLFDTNPYGTSTRTIGATYSLADQSTGIWFLIQKRGQFVTFSYSFTDQTSPPTTWTRAPWGDAASAGMINSASNVWLFHFGLYRWNTTYGGPIGEMSYYKEYLGAIPYSSNYSWHYGTSADGNIGGDIQLVNTFDLGSSSATIDLTQLRTILASSVNNRGIDNGTWTFSVVRGSAAPEVGTYAASSSVTIEGSGRYISIWARCTLANSTDYGSLNPAKVCIRYST